MIKEQHLRNINLVGSTDVNILADFNTNLGQRYQLALAVLANYRTTIDYNFNVGMQSTLLSSGVAQTISSITSAATTATVTTSGAHGYTTGNIIAIAGAAQSGYNGTFTITVTGTTTFTYSIVAQSVTTATVSQFYPFPQGEVTVEGMYITIGSVNYPLQIINSRWDWEQLNAIQIQASAIPQFYFPQRDTFGIWPTPQTVYSGTMSYHYRDRNLSIADYSTGTVTVTNGSTQITGTGTFTPAMVGRWFEITDPTIPGQGYWYLITSYTSATIINVNRPWTAATATGATYVIGETPDIPEELHAIMAWGATADYYGGMQKDPTNNALYDNLFWTGSASNTSRQRGDDKIIGGLLGGQNRYASRDNTRIVKRRPKLSPLQSKIWATSLS